MIITRILRNEKHPDTWDLLVNDKLEVEAESLAFCENVVRTLETGVSAWPTEADEVAAAIEARITR